ncbi:MAG: hypothetical protein AAF710_07945 [Planctomycetota bacterium]
MSDAEPAGTEKTDLPGEPMRGVGPTLLWACFLGCSWTWVIGMFLPVMLLRDHGVWGWVAFAVPNVLGAAAMGTVLRTPEASWRLVQRHGPMLRGFASVTIAYQVFVVSWLFEGLWWPAVCLLLLVPWLVMDGPRKRRLGSWLPWIAVGAALVSFGAFSSAGRLDGAWLNVREDTLPSRLSPLALGLLTPGLIVGFALCPYLDPTFHRARIRTSPGTGAAAFAVGFVGVFGSMIVFSLMYAGLLRPVVDGEASVSSLSPPWQALLLIHVGLQVGFTMLVHGRERFGGGEGRRVGGFAGLLVATVALGMWASTGPALPDGLTLGEVVYRLFLLAYGAVFPAYVLICMVPARRPGGTDAARRRRVFVLTSCVAYPLGAMGFIVGPAWWLLGLYAAIVGGRLVVDATAGRQAAD